MGPPPTQDDASRATPGRIARAWAWLWPVSIPLTFLGAELLSPVVGWQLPKAWESWLDTATVQLSVRWLVHIIFWLPFLLVVAGKAVFHLAQRKQPGRSQNHYVLLALRSELVGNEDVLAGFGQESGVVAGKGTRLRTDQLERALADHIPMLGEHGAIGSVQGMIAGCQKINGLLHAVESLCSMSPSAAESQRHNYRARRAARDVMIDASIVLDRVRALLSRIDQLLPEDDVDGP